MVSRGSQSYTLNFEFDTGEEFSGPIFERLAGELPALVFHCSATGSLDEFTAESWYNGSSGRSKMECSGARKYYWKTFGMSVLTRILKHQLMVGQ